MATETVKTKMVKIRLPLTRTETKDEYVAVNGKSYQIKRGVDVEVPDYVAKAIQDSEDMLSISMAFEAQAKEKVE
ncbi:MAG: hypothetical protein U0M60_21695 [Clostridia bacterium]|nr:hypothetical protein [Clostridia bacterium]